MTNKITYKQILNSQKFIAIWGEGHDPTLWIQHDYQDTESCEQYARFVVESLDCLRLVQQLAGGQDWREWLKLAEQSLKIQELIISYGLNHKKLEQLLLDTINWESEQ